MLERIRIPGLFWVALIIFVIQWLPQIFPPGEYQWVQGVMLVLYALLKAVEVLVGVVPADSQPSLPEVRSEQRYATSTRVSRLFF